MKLVASNTFEWVDLPVDIAVDGYYVFFELEENTHIEVAIAGYALPTTLMFQKDPNESFWNINVVGSA